MKEKEEKEELIPLAEPRMVDFIALNIEKREKVPDMGCCSERAVGDCRGASLHAGRFFTVYSRGH